MMVTTYLIIFNRATWT